MRRTSGMSARIMRGWEHVQTWQVFVRHKKHGPWAVLPEPPRFALLVSGGKVAEKVARKIHAYLEDLERGRKYSKAIVLDAVHAFMPHGPRYSAIVRYLDARETVEGGMRAAVRLVAPGGAIAAETFGRKTRRGPLVHAGLLRPSFAPLASGPLQRGRPVRSAGEMRRMFGGKTVAPKKARSARKARRA